MKKTVIALAAMIAASSSALAADFTLYGVVDLGFTYTNADSESAKTESFKLDSGKNAGSRWGLKGREDLGNGYAVAFQLENSFSADTGAIGGDRLFHRETRLSFETPVATVSFGRMGGLTSGAGTFDIFQAQGDALDGGWDYNFNVGNWFSRSRCDNMLTVNSANLNGFTLYAQYSFGTDSTAKDPVDKKTLIKNDGVQNNRDTERYAAVGATYENGPLAVGLFLDTVMRRYGDGFNVGDKDTEDAKAVSFSASYDFDVAKVFFAAQYGRNESLNFFTGTVDHVVDGESAADDISSVLMDGYRIGVGASTNLPCGTLTGGVYYGSMKNDTDFGDDTVKAKNFNVAIGHTYPFSKRTYSYVGVAYKSVDMKAGSQKIAEEDSFTTQVGLVHKF